MSRFENGYLISDIRSRSHSQSANESSTQVGDNISVEVGEQKYVELMRLLNELRTQIIHKPVFELDVGISIGNIPSHVEK
ncbi:hypothetical protein ES703_125791 [subsurface metagenome]